VVGRQPYVHPNDDFVQAGDLYRKAMTDQDQNNLVGNIVAHLSGAQKRLQLRQAAIFLKAYEEYGRRVAEGLGLDIALVEKLARMTQEERVRATAI
jgi:catalase